MNNNPGEPKSNPYRNSNMEKYIRDMTSFYEDVLGLDMTGEQRGGEASISVQKSVAPMCP